MTRQRLTRKNNLQDSKTAVRFWRGIALILMILYHLVFDLHYFFQSSWLGNPFQGFWPIIGSGSAILFILLAGIATAGIQQSFPAQFARRKNLLRAGKILLGAAMITLVTRFFFPETTIYFGILHFLGLAVFVTAFTRLSWLNAFGWAFLFFGIYKIMPPLSLRPLAIFWGQAPADFRSLDYFPFFPWFSLFLIGIGLENLRQLHYFPLRSTNCSSPAIEWLGRHSLWIYLLHQPIIMGSVYLIHNVLI